MANYLGHNFIMVELFGVPYHTVWSWLSIEVCPMLWLKPIP